MIYNGKAKIEDGIVKCASQMCDECEFLEAFNCINVTIIDEEENLGRKILITREEIKRGNYD